MRVNKKRLSELLGISEPTLTQYQREGMPLVAKGSRGKENEYDVAAVIAWFKNRLKAEQSVTIQHKKHLTRFSQVF